MHRRTIGLRPYALLAAALLVSSCAMFAPRYDLTLDQKTSEAYERIALLAAKGELGSYAEPASFAATAPDYADAQAKLAVAALRAAGLDTGGKRAVEARRLLVGLIKGCSDRVGSFARQHKAFGIRPDSGASQSMMVSCDQAAKAAQAMKPGG